MTNARGLSPAPGHGDPPRRWDCPLSLLALVCLLLAAAPPSLRADPRETLTVGAAASLQDAMSEIARAFEKGEGVEVRATYAGSGRLRKQIEAGAPIDVFVTARSAMLEEMAREGRITETTVFATNVLVVIVPGASDARPLTLADLADPRYRRVGLGNPGYVPAGIYARAALEAAGVYGRIAPRLVFGEHVRQVLAYAARGEVDAALVYRTDAANRKDVRVAFEVPGSAGERIAYGAGVNAGAGHPPLARRFLAFLRGTEAKRVLKEHGFGVPDSREGARPAAARSSPRPAAG